MKPAWMLLPLSLLVAGCQPEPDEAPPVGETTVAATPVIAADAVADATLAQRHADFRLARRDARDVLEQAWAACDGGADADACRERALGDYDAAIAVAARDSGLSGDEVVDVESERPLPSPSTLVAFSGTRG